MDMAMASLKRSLSPRQALHDGLAGILTVCMLPVVALGLVYLKWMNPDGKFAIIRKPYYLAFIALGLILTRIGVSVVQSIVLKKPLDRRMEAALAVAVYVGLQMALGAPLKLALVAGGISYGSVMAFRGLSGCLL